MSNTTNEQDRKEFSFEENFIDETIIADKSSKTKEFIKKFMKRKTAVAGFIVIVFLVFLAIFGQYLAPYDPDAYDYSNMLAGPSAAHLFGTDHYGRDILSRLLAGTRLTLGVSLSSVVVGAALGTVLGLLAGYYGGIIESLVMRASDVLFSFPDILLAIAIVSAMGQSTLNLMIAVGICSSASFVQISRAAVLTVRNNEYVEAARAIGSNSFHTVFSNILPNSLAPIIVQATLRVGASIISASSLSFLGIGVPLPAPEWGAMLSGGRAYIRDYSYMTLFPGLAIMLTVVSLNLVGDALRDAIDPKLKK